MKRSTKTVLTVAGVALALGLAMNLTGLAMGGRSGREYSDMSGFLLGPAGLHIGGKNGFHITEDGIDIGGIHGVHLGPDGLNVGNANISQDTKTVARELGKEDLEGFTSVDVDVDFGDIWLQEGEEFSVSMSWNLKNYDIRCWVEKDVLKIEDQSENEKGNSGVSLFSKVIITMPTGTKLEKVRLYTDMGDINVDAGITVQNASLETDLGDIFCAGLTAEWLEVNTDLGDVEITFPQREGVSYTLETDFGEIRVDGKGQGDSINVGASDEQYVIFGKSSLGDVSLRLE